jgi:hypothetical protein
VDVNPDHRQGRRLPFDPGFRTSPLLRSVHETRTVAGRSGDPECCGRSDRLAFPRRAGQGRSGRGDGRCLGFRISVADRHGGGSAVVAGPGPGGSRREHSGDSRGAGGVEMVDRDPPPRQPRNSRSRTGRGRHRGRLCRQRRGQAGGRRGTALPGAARGGRRDRRMPPRRGLVVPEQSRHPGRRIRCRPGRSVAATGGGHAALGRSGGAVACPGRSALPARCAGRGRSRRRRGGGGAACLHATCSAHGVTPGGAPAEERFRPRAP